MNEQELLEFAARAVGFDYDYNVGKIFRTVQGYPMKLDWNPLEDDGDALRLAVKLKLHIKLTCIGCTINAPLKGVFLGESCEDDEYTTTRRAIVRAAAEIGRRMV